MKSGQIWVETVIYTLIGLSLIGLVLAVVTPKINEFKDRSVIENSIASLNALDSKMNEVLAAPGNVRIIEYNMRRGSLYFDPANNKIYFELDDSKVLFSEPGIETGVGNIKVLTTEGNKRHTITLTLEYAEDLTFNGDNVDVKKFVSTSVPYRFSIENSGFSNGNIGIDIKEIS